MSLDFHARHIRRATAAGQHGGYPRCPPPGWQACPAPGQWQSWQSGRAGPGREVGPTPPGACEDHRAHKLLPPRRAGRNGEASVTRNPPARRAAVALLATATGVDRAVMVSVEPAHSGEKLVLLRPGQEARGIRPGPADHSAGGNAPSRANSDRHAVAGDRHERLASTSNVGVAHLRAPSPPAIAPCSATRTAMRPES